MPGMLKMEDNLSCIPSVKLTSNPMTHLQFQLYQYGIPWLHSVLPRKFSPVREVISETKPRVSISGWFHTTQTSQVERTEGTLSSTLQQLQSKHFLAGEKLEYVLPSTSSSTTMSEPFDLQKWINPEYLTQEGIAQIRKVLEKEHSVQLFSFLLPSIRDLIRSTLNREDHRNRRNRLNYDYGCGYGWVVKGPPHLQILGL